MEMMRMELEVDRISNLPDDVTEKILSCLSLKEAVRTSILSSKWRCKWNMLQALVFDNECVSTQNSLVNVVDHVLLLHIGPILKFMISFQNADLAPKDLDRWIFHLLRNHGIKEMMIDFWTGDPYNIPPYMFSCQDIAYLELFRCSLNPPSTRKGFKILTTLHLEKVTVAQHVLENLISCSPLLEKLHLVKCDGFTDLKIDAPNLWLIYIDGVFENFNLVGSPNLVVAYFELQVNNVDHSPASSSSLNKFFDDHPRIQRLEIRDGNFLEYLCRGVFPEKLPKPCQYLNFLSLHINFDDPDEISTLLCLLRSSPALQKLRIVVIPEDDQPAAREVKSCSYDDYNCTQTQLRLVKITDLTCAKAQLDFIKFLLLSSPVLERITVEPASVDGFPNLLKELLKFKRDSKGAEIMVLDP